MPRRKKRSLPLTIPAKTNRILQGILIVLFLIGVRLWHIAVIQHQEKIEASQKPQRRVVIEKAERATICDRFGIELATNKVQYNAAVAYGEIRNIPRTVWIKNQEGKKVKCNKRKEYITSLAQTLADLLQIDAEYLEDLIHSKASLFGSVPFVIKENISEKQYFRLKMLEKDFPGACAEIVARRTYPLGPIGGEVVGYMGAISSSEYTSITKEMKLLRETLSQEEEELPSLPEGYISLEQVKARYKELEGKAYTLNDFIGKAGVEGAYDENLRGIRGRRIYLSDIKGNFSSELPGSEAPLPGNRLFLSISAELQEYAERLLTEYEQAFPSPRIAQYRNDGLLPDKQPWIKGGAIVAMEPYTGEIIALASYPRFNPNDFIRPQQSKENKEKIAHVHQWLEDETYLGLLWDGKVPLERERFQTNEPQFFLEKNFLNWDLYLQLILPSKSSLKHILNEKCSIGDALYLQEKVTNLLSFFEEAKIPLFPAQVFDFIFQNEHEEASKTRVTLLQKNLLKERFSHYSSEIEELKSDLAPYFSLLPLTQDKLLLTDLYRLCVDPALFNSSLKETLSTYHLEEFCTASSHFVSIAEAVQEKVKMIFHDTHFKKWKENSFKAYLAGKRKEESKQKKKNAKPYIEYLEEAEKILFEKFWENAQKDLLTFFLRPSSYKTSSPPHLIPYLILLERWKKEMLHEEANSFKFHYHHFIAKIKELSIEILPNYLNALRSFKDLNRPLLGSYAGLRRTKEGIQLEKHLATAFYPLYGYGYTRSQAFRQATTIGSLFKLVPAYEALRQRYLKFKENGEQQFDLNPLVIIDDKQYSKGKGWTVGFTTEGKTIPHYYHGGRLPRSDHAGIGKVDLIKALEASSNPYFAILAGDVLDDPEDICHAANLLGFGEKTGIALPGEIAGTLPIDVAYNRTGLYAMAIGQHSLITTPLQAAVMLSTFANGGNVLQPKIVMEEKIGERSLKIPTTIRHQIFLPPPIRNLLLKGLRQSVMGEKGTARSLRNKFPSSLVSQIIGKTSTSEVMERLCLVGPSTLVKCKHVWFGAISFNPAYNEDFTNPNLIVIVYLRFGEFGNEVAPLAAKIIKKWDEIVSQRKNNSSLS